MAFELQRAIPNASIFGIDNLSRRGSETNWRSLQQTGVRVMHGDVRVAGDLEELPPADWVIDCAANPSVLAGLAGQGGDSSRRLVDNNLVGTVHLLEYCRRHGAGFVLLSTSRVYSWPELHRIPLRETETRLEIDSRKGDSIPGLSERGIAETFSTEPPASLYGMTKRCSELMALEYAEAFKFPLWINRCGVIAGPGQFGKPDQGILAYWAYASLMKLPLKYIGFGGKGKQVRDFVLAEDVAQLVLKQIKEPNKQVPRLLNVGGGLHAALSLLELTRLCEKFYGHPIAVAADPNPRPYDVPYYVSDTHHVQHAWNWEPSQSAEAIGCRSH